MKRKFPRANITKIPRNVLWRATRKLFGKQPYDVKIFYPCIKCGSASFHKIIEPQQHNFENYKLICSECGNIVNVDGIIYDFRNAPNILHDEWNKANARRVKLSKI